MNACQIGFKSDRPLARFQAIDAIEFIGPIGSIGSDIPIETPQMGDGLPLAQPGFPFAQSLLGLFWFGNVAGNALNELDLASSIEYWIFGYLHAMNSSILR